MQGTAAQLSVEYVHRDFSFQPFMNAAGFGPGVGIQLLAEKAFRGTVLGMFQSCMLALIQ